MSKNIKYKSCYVISPPGKHIPNLKRNLVKLGIRTLEPIFTFGENIAEELQKTIRKADFVIGYISKDGFAEDSCFEMGVAVACGKPLFIISEPQANQPQFLKRFPYVITDFQNSEIFDFHLKAFLSHFKDKMKVEMNKSQQIDLTDERQKFSKLLSENRTGSTFIEFEKLVQSIVSYAGVTEGLEVSQHGDQFYDIALWIDEIEPIVANPILIEVKFSQKNLRKEFFERFHNQLLKSGSHFGIIVVPSLEQYSSLMPSPSWPAILLISIEELIELVEKRQLSKRIISYRNQISHGGV